MAGQVQIIPPSPDEVNHIHAIYTELAQTGEGSEEQRKQLTAIANTLRKRDGVDAIVLAGTDLALLFNDSNADFPYVDCAKLHIQAILQNLEESGSKNTEVAT
jgi:aspartate racemase